MDQPPVAERNRKERKIADDDDATTWLHRLVKRGGRINDQEANGGGAEQGQNMLGRVVESLRVRVAIVATDDKQGGDNRREFKPADEWRMRRRGVKLDGSDITDQSANCSPGK